MSKRPDMAERITNPLEMHRQHWPESYDAQMLPLGLALAQAYTAQHSRAARVMAANGLSSAEFDVLASLRRTPPPHALTPSDIQRTVLITSGGLTKVLRQLEARGLVTRSMQDADRRVKPVALAAQAMPVLEKTMSELHTVIGDWMRRSLTDAEIRRLASLLTKLVNGDSST
ncbi:MAG TPA: MarR family transcriptional regulator [Thiobacillus sp.]|nr:MarR family transcriptional regulator [Thiobacillus sp.]